MTTLVLLWCCELLDNCRVQIHNKCTEPPMMESIFLRTSVLLILGQNYSDSAVCRLRLCIFQSYCNLFHTYSLNSCSKPGKEGQAPLSVPVVLRIWFPQVVQVSFSPQLFTLSFLLSRPVIFLFSSWGMWCIWRLHPSILLFSKFFHWKIFSLFSHNLETVKQIFCKLSRPIYLGDKTKKAFSMFLCEVRK